MATAGTIVFEIKIAVDIVLAEDGMYYVDASTTKGDAVHSWTEGPFTNGPRRVRACSGSSPCR